MKTTGQHARGSFCDICTAGLATYCFFCTKARTKAAAAVVVDAGSVPATSTGAAPVASAPSEGSTGFTTGAKLEPAAGSKVVEESVGVAIESAATWFKGLVGISICTSTISVASFCCIAGCVSVCAFSDELACIGSICTMAVSACRVSLRLTSTGAAPAASAPSEGSTGFTTGAELEPAAGSKVVEESVGVAIESAATCILVGFKGLAGISICTLAMSAVAGRAGALNNGFACISICTLAALACRVSL